MNGSTLLGLAIATSPLVAACASAPPPAPPPVADPIVTQGPCPMDKRSTAMGNPAAPEFDRDAAMRAMSSLDVSACAKKVKGTSGCAQVRLEFEPTGNVGSATTCETSLPDAVRTCIQKRFMALSIPAFRDRAMATQQKVCVGGAT